MNQIIAGILAVFLALVSALFATYYYHGEYVTASKALADLRASVAAANVQATARLADLTAERDRIQTELNQKAADQEQKDAQAKAEISRLTVDVSNLRVRVVPNTAGSCSGNASGQTASATDAGTADQAPAYGVLPEVNSRRLASALTEVETLSAAYNSCRATVVGEP